jgi:hypothetical protein
MGIVHGLSLSLLIYDEDVDSDDLRVMAALSVLGSIGESIAGYQIAKNNNLSEGTASIISMGGVAGTLYGFGFAKIADDYRSSTKLGSLLLIGSAAGYAAGYLLSKDQKYTAGDAMYVTTAAATGAYSGLVLSEISEWDNEGRIGSMIVGSAAGIAAGHFLTNKYDFNKTQGVVNLLSTGFGTLVGLGFGQSMVHGDDQHKWSLGLSVAGAAAGYAVSYLGFRGSALENADQVSIDLHANPVALAWQPDPANPQPMEALRLSISF